MTKEEKELLLKDLCARLPYGVIVRGIFINYNKEKNKILYEECDKELNIQSLTNNESLKPYLRPMSSMTEEEEIEMTQILEEVYDSSFTMDKLVKDVRMQEYIPSKYVDWLNKYHFDYRGLIKKGLALKAKEGMYVIK